MWCWRGNSDSMHLCVCAWEVASHPLLAFEFTDEAKTPCDIVEQHRLEARRAAVWRQYILFQLLQHRKFQVHQLCIRDVHSIANTYASAFLPSQLLQRHQLQSES